LPTESKEEPDLLWTRESESKEESDLLWTRESESKEESDLIWTPEPESTEESDLFWTQEPESTEEPDLLWTPESSVGQWISGGRCSHGGAETRREQREESTTRPRGQLVCLVLLPVC
jgi:hypothetical protein